MNKSELEAIAQFNKITLNYIKMKKILSGNTVKLREDCSNCKHGDVKTGVYPCSECGSKFNKWKAIE